MEKKRYEELEIEVVRFTAEDVVATSGGTSCESVIGPGAPNLPAA